MWVGIDNLRTVVMYSISQDFGIVLHGTSTRPLPILQISQLLSLYSTFAATLLPQVPFSFVSQVPYTNIYLQSCKPDPGLQIYRYKCFCLDIMHIQIQEFKEARQTALNTFHVRSGNNSTSLNFSIVLFLPFLHTHTQTSFPR